MMRRATLVLGLLIVAVPAVRGAERRTPLHPPVPLLDSSGQLVVTSGKPISTLTTCAACHDSQYIAAHSYHAWVGQNESFPAGAKQATYPWDSSPGTFGRWDPIFYRYLTAPGANKLDLSTAEWIRYRGWRHAGGGPATVGHGSVALDQRGPSSTAANSTVDPDTQTLNTKTGEPESWDWKASGTVEMNCFLCHLSQPDNAARVEELEQGHFRWAGTATLAATGLVARAAAGWKYNKQAFSAKGEAPANVLALGKPTAEHCGQCHGRVQYGPEPLTLKLDTHSFATATKGQVFSPQRISMAGVNIQDKQQLTRPWDVHAESMLECRNCHFSLNDPATFQPSSAQLPKHLRFEPRRQKLSEYLVSPSHQFAKGDTAQGRIAPRSDASMRTCDQCHDADAVHDWLP